MTMKKFQIQLLVVDNLNQDVLAKIQVLSPLIHLRVGLRAGPERVDLGRIQPGQWEPGSTEECDVGEKSDGGALGRLLVSRDQCTKGEHHGQALTHGSNDEKLAASNSLDEVPRCSSENGVNHHVNAAKEK